MSSQPLSVWLASSTHHQRVDIALDEALADVVQNGSLAQLVQVHQVFHLVCQVRTADLRSGCVSIGRVDVDIDRPAFGCAELDMIIAELCCEGGEGEE